MVAAESSITSGFGGAGGAGGNPDGAEGAAGFDSFGGAGGDSGNGGDASLNGLRSWAGAIYYGENCEVDISDTEISYNATTITIQEQPYPGGEPNVPGIGGQVDGFDGAEGAEGLRLFWNGDVRRFRPPKVDEVDATGAGDIFATAFFVRLYTTRDPWEAARFATQVSARSVTRPGLKGVPTESEIKDCMMEIL